MIFGFSLCAVYLYIALVIYFRKKLLSVMSSASSEFELSLVFMLGVVCTRRQKLTGLAQEYTEYRNSV